MAHFAVALVISVLVGAVPVSRAEASDFWDEVRTPGLRVYRRHMSEARAALESGRVDDALVEATAAVERLPDRAEAHVLRGRALGELGMLDDASAALRRALEADRGALDGATDGTHAAQILATAGDHETAAVILPRVLGRMRPSAARVEVHTLLGDVLLTLGPEHLEAAKSAFREAVRDGGRGQLRALLGLALALVRDGQEREALELARDAASQMPAIVRTLPVPETERAARRAVVLDAIGDAGGALEAWRAAAQAGPWQEHAERALSTRARRPRAPTDGDAR
jgi:tetratricopeptide (TPR) repeat protein